MKNHGVIQAEDTLYDSLDCEIALHQPVVKQEWLDHFDNLLKKEKRMPYVSMFLKIMVMGLVGYTLLKVSSMNICQNFDLSCLYKAASNR